MSLAPLPRRVRSSLVLILGFPSIFAGESLLGHKDFYPSPDHPVGYRGDGSAAFPGATPVAGWAERTGLGYVQTDQGGKWTWQSETPVNIVWKTPIPRPDIPYRGVCPVQFEGQSSAGPVIIGDLVVTTADPYFLYVYDMNTGKERWRADCSHFEAMPAENKVEALSLLAQDPWKLWLEAFKSKDKAAGGTFDSSDVPAALRKLNALGVKYPLNWGEHVFTYTGHAYQTPVSDGEYIWATFRNCMVVCYDLAGKRRWATWDYKLTNRGLSYGHCKSPVLVGEVLIVDLGDANDGSWRQTPTLRLAGFDKRTGRKLWEREQRNHSTHGAATGEDCPLVVNVAGKPRTVMYSSSAGECYDPLTGAVLIDDILWSEAHASPVLDRDRRDVFYLAICPDGGASKHPQAYHLHAIQVESGPDGRLAWKTLWKTRMLPQGATSAGGANRGPAYHDGELYSISHDKGGEAVYDAATGKLLTAFPGFQRGGNAKAGGWSGYPSTTLAGQTIFLMRGSATATTEVPGAPGAKSAVQVNILLQDEDLTGAPIAMAKRRFTNNQGYPFFSGNRLVIRTHENLYCIGDPKVPYDWNPASRPASIPVPPLPSP